MSFKTFNCVVDFFTLEPIPPEGWNTEGDTIFIQAAGNTVQGYHDCDPNLSGFWGANNVSPGMSQEDFYELWPLLVMVLIAGVCVRVIRKVFEI